MKAAQKQENFEENLEKLDGIVKKMEAGGMPLAEMLRCFEEGSALSEKLKKQLQAAQTRLTEVRMQGEIPVEEPAEYAP